MKKAKHLPYLDQEKKAPTPPAPKSVKKKLQRAR